MGLFGAVLLMGLGGSVVGRMWTFVIGLGGMPGVALTFKAAMETKPDEQLPLTIPALLITVLGQLYVALVWVAFVVESTRSLGAEYAGVGKWLLWTVAFWAASVPTMGAVRSAARTERKGVQHVATTLTLPLAAIGLLLFIFLPVVLEVAWGWVPHL